MQNTIYSLEDLFTINIFRIPQYQRAYSWDKEPHLSAFLDDLRQQVTTQKKSPKKQYFLGTFLLHEEDIGKGKMVTNVVDGQQRLTTSVIFIATALLLHEENKTIFGTARVEPLRRHFVLDSDDDRQKFCTITEDDPFFRSEILGIAADECKVDSPSSRRMKAAVNYFKSQIALDEWKPLVNVLRTAKVMVYAVDSAEDATQIFELQNDRGKSLTNLEALKSFLMHCIYLHSPVNADDRLAALHTQFSKIFRTVEALAEWKRTPSEDRMLANHCAAFLKWSDAEYSDPKRLVKSHIKKMNEGGIIAWVEGFVGSLVDTYKTIEYLFSKRNEFPEFSDLLLLNRMGSFWPLILKAWRHDVSVEKINFRKACRLLEVFTFRGYAVANLRSDSGLSTLYTRARDFSGNFEGLFTQLCVLCHENNLEARFILGLDNANLYKASGHDALYLLWRYENHLRSQPGRKQPLLSWQDFVEPRDYAAKFSLEHVAAQENLMSATEVSWDGAEPRPFHQVALHRLGNLVIDSISPNASKGKKDFSDKLKSLSEHSIYLSQGELLSFLKDRESLSWDMDSIKARHDHLTAFARKMWAPSTWHNPAEIA
jgi:hypothetical protein